MQTEVLSSAIFDRETAKKRLPAAPRNGLTSSLEHKRLQFYLIMMLADVVILIASFFVMTLVYNNWDANSGQIDSGLLPAYLLLPVFLTIALYNGCYSQTSLTRSQQSVMRVGSALVISAALLNFFAFYGKMNAEFSRVIFTTGILSSLMLMIVFRIAFATWLTRRWGPNPKNQLVIYAGGPRFTLPFAFHIDAQDHGLDPNANDPMALDRLAKYLCNMDEVIVSCDEDHRLQWAEVLKGSGRHGEIVSGFARQIGAMGVIHHDGAKISSLLVSSGHLGLRARAQKRLFDIVVSSAALFVLSPLMAAVAVAIKLHDGGPVFFRQRRMGRGNQFFDIFKFRSMGEADADGDRSASKDDDRITPVGRFIRRTSIDELPQLINVLIGNMSLVGPRPHALGSKAGTKLFWQVDRKYWQRHGLRPGITGLAQVRGYRGATDKESDLTNRLQADLEYLQGWSLWRDIKILLATATVLVHDRAF
nr:exopolysaccharide biosynthesis polyprenyl glycosylphosphotransferase [Aurantiacibacter sp. 219JJ12-13]MDP5260696.1 exopolysaccharide biosynthesis polyprenyl glycosylphosphotransferase [Aurantiacibacter sp. 219JJ12-13]